MRKKNEEGRRRRSKNRMEIFVVFRQEKLNKDQHHKKMSGNGNVVVTAVGSSADPERLLHVLRN